MDKETSEERKERREKVLKKFGFALVEDDNGELFPEKMKHLNVGAKKPTITKKLRLSAQMKRFLLYLKNGDGDLGHFQSLEEYGKEKIVSMFGTISHAFSDSWSLQRMAKALYDRGLVNRGNRFKDGYYYSLSEKGKELVKANGEEWRKRLKLEEYYKAKQT